MNCPFRNRRVGLTLALAATLGLPAGARGQALAVRFELADGARVSDTTTVVARPTAPPGADVQQVAFAVDGSVRYTDSSTPYSYDWDTLQETEGEHTLTATVTDSKGHTASAQIRVTVDNELSKGAEYHATAALEALHAGNATTARNRMRRALKLDPKNLTAARVKAGLLKQDGNIDGAIAALEAATIPDSDFEVRSDLWALHMAAASPDIDMAAYVRHVTTAAELHHKSASARAASLKGDDPATAVRRGDVHLEDRQWDPAIRDYELAADLDHATGSVANRFVLAYLLSGKDRDAMTLLQRLRLEKRSDEVTPALEGMRMLQLFRFDDARKAVRDQIEAGNLPGLLVEAYADLALKDATRGRDAVRRAMEIAPDNPDVLILQARYATGGEDPRDALVRAARSNPTTPEPFVIYGFLEMMRTDEKRFERADLILRAALKVAPDSRVAMLANALCRLGMKDTDGALTPLKRLRELTKAGDVETVYALACRRQQNDDAARAALDNAARLAPYDWGGGTIDALPDLIAHVYRYRLSPVLTPATLYTGRTAK